ncbi:MAG: aconitase X swivel domain-containing protein [Candidatus Binatia bacterium]
MMTLRGKAFFGGHGTGEAVVSRTPINFTAAFTKPHNFIPSRRGEIRDRHHDLFGTNVAGRVLVFPACVGSSFTGMVLMQLMSEGRAPAAIIVQSADSLLVSGTVLAQVWFQKGVPVVEYRADDLFEKIRTGDRVAVDGETGEIRIGA